MLTFKKFIEKYFTKSLMEYNKLLKLYKSRLIVSSNENSEWLSSNLIGVHNIVFKDEYYDMLFTLLEINEDDFSKDLLKLKEYRKEWKTSSNPMYVLLTTLMSLAIADKNLRKQDKEDLVMNAGFILHFKIYTSKYKVFFKIPFTEAEAKKIYEAMSMHSLIKKYGSNYKVIEHQCRMLLPDTKLGKRLEKVKFEMIIYIINSVSTAIAQLLKGVWKIKKEIEDEANISSNSIIEEDETDRISEISHVGMVYHNVAKQVILNPHTLVDKNLIKIINDLVSNVDNKILINTLEYLTDYYLKRPDIVLKLLADIVNASVDYLYKHEIYMPFEEKFDLVMIKLKGLWTSNKILDPRVKETKELLSKILVEKLHIEKYNIMIRHANVTAIYIISRIILHMKLNHMRYHKQVAKALRNSKKKIIVTR